MLANLTQIYFTFSHYKNDFDGDQNEIEQLKKAVLERMQKAIEEVPYQLNITPFIDFKLFYVFYDRTEKTLRWVGNNPEECVPWE